MSDVMSRADVQRVDREAIETYRIPGIVLMENAARGLAAVATEMLDRSPARVLVMCGSGNNGGDGYALARHLEIAGHEPTIFALRPPRPHTDAIVNASICDAMGLPRITLDELLPYRDADLIVDSLFGTGLTRPIEGDAAIAIEWINAAGRPVLAVDVPTGLDCDTGRPLGAAVVRATRTVTFVAAKTGFDAQEALAFTGPVTVAHIGAPRRLVEHIASGA